MIDDFSGWSSPRRSSTEEEGRVLAALGRKRWKGDPTASDLALTDRRALSRLMEKLKITK